MSLCCSFHVGLAILSLSLNNITVIPTSYPLSPYTVYSTPIQSYSPTLLQPYIMVYRPNILYTVCLEEAVYICTQSTMQIFAEFSTYVQIK